MWIRHLSISSLFLCIFIVEVRCQKVLSFCTTSFTREQVPGRCRPLVKCIRHFEDIPKLVHQPCTLKSGAYGVCCPNFTRLKPKKKHGLLKAPPPPKVDVPPIKTKDINTAAEDANVKRQGRVRLEVKLRRLGIRTRSRGPERVHRHLQRSNKRSRKLSKQATKVIDTSINLVRGFGLSKDQGRFALPQFATAETTLILKQTDEESDCANTESGPASCNNFRNMLYRSEDGTCNNLKHSLWGRANVALTRLLAPDYEDGVSIPRGKLLNGTEFLPSPRLISGALISHEDRPNRDYTLLLMQWGQFIDHDITHTPINKGASDDVDNTENVNALVESETEIICCQDGFKLPGDLLHPECHSIDIPPNDHFYSRLGQRCMEFVRSMPAERPDCNLGPREQLLRTGILVIRGNFIGFLVLTILDKLSLNRWLVDSRQEWLARLAYQNLILMVNQITSFIDASNIYGSDISITKRLRLGRRGRLRVTKLGKEELLPLAPEECADFAKRHYCFAAGDLRCNEQPQLTVMHTIWLREHNRIASQLLLLNPHWDDERLYQESRRIVIAEIQHITYNEWLPIILGMTYIDAFQMKPADSGFSKQYDDNVNPSITNVFATAAFRFGHSLVDSSLKLVESSRSGRALTKSLPLHKHQLSPFAIYEENSIDGFVRGLTTQAVQSFDSSFTEELTERLFQGDDTHGMDLVALNVQRGRDHGLPPYLEWRKICGLPRITSWQGLAAVVEKPNLVPRLQRLYGSIEEVDLYIGGTIERPLEGSLLGPTFQCIVGDQFRRLRLGDRYWYEEPNQIGSFTLAQVDAIKEASLSRILCDNSEKNDEMQPMAFRSVTKANTRVNCNSQAIPRVDLSAWKE